MLMVFLGICCYFPEGLWECVGEGKKREIWGSVFNQTKPKLCKTLSGWTLCQFFYVRWKFWLLEAQHSLLCFQPVSQWCNCPLKKGVGCYDAQEVWFYHIVPLLQGLIQLETVTH